MSEQIKPYILEKGEYDRFGWYRYLHIKGGSGNWKGKSDKFLNGGEFDYCLFYASPAEMEGLNCCERIWCIKKDIPFGTGKTIEDAYKSYLENIKLTINE